MIPKPSHRTGLLKSAIRTIEKKWPQLNPKNEKMPFGETDSAWMLLDDDRKLKVERLNQTLCRNIRLSLTKFAGEGLHGFGSRKGIVRGALARRRREESEDESTCTHLGGERRPFLNPKSNLKDNPKWANPDSNLTSSRRSRSHSNLNLGSSQSHSKM